MGLGGLEKFPPAAAAPRPTALAVALECKIKTLNPRHWSVLEGREEKALGEAGVEKSTTDGCRFYVLTTVGVNGNTWVGLCELKHL